MKATDFCEITQYKHK